MDYVYYRYTVFSFALPYIPLKRLPHKFVHRVQTLSIYFLEPSMFLTWPQRVNISF